MGDGWMIQSYMFSFALLPSGGGLVQQHLATKSCILNLEYFPPHVMVLKENTFQSGSIDCFL